MPKQSGYAPHRRGEQTVSIAWRSSRRQRIGAIDKAATSASFTFSQPNQAALSNLLLQPLGVSSPMSWTRKSIFRWIRAFITRIRIKEDKRADLDWGRSLESVILTLSQVQQLPRHYSANNSRELILLPIPISNSRYRQLLCIIEASDKQSSIS